MINREGVAAASKTLSKQGRKMAYYVYHQLCVQAYFLCIEGKNRTLRTKHPSLRAVSPEEVTGM